MEIRTGKVRTGSFCMDHFSFGSGGKTLVILPGLSVQPITPAAQAVALAYSVFAKDFTVYLFDRVSDPPAGYTVRDMARDTENAISSLGLDEIYLFGASQGGMIALEMAAEHKINVKKLAVASSALHTGDAAAAITESWINKALSGDAEGLYSEFGRTVYPEDVFLRYGDTLSAAAKTVTRDELERFAIFASAVKGYFSSANRNNVRCPLFAVGSDDDAIFGADSVNAFDAEFGENAYFSSFLYRGFGHAVYDTAPDFKERLYGFFIS